MSKQRLGKYFLLRQKLNVHLVLEIKDGVDRPDVGVVAGEVEGEADAKEHQLWFSDHVTQTIRSKLNNFCLDLNSKLSISTCVHLNIGCCFSINLILFLNRIWQITCYSGHPLCLQSTWFYFTWCLCTYIYLLVTDMIYIRLLGS